MVIQREMEKTKSGCGKEMMKKCKGADREGETKSGRGGFLTVLHRHPGPDPPRRFVDDDLLHPIFPPLPKHRRDLLPRPDPRCLETENGHRRFDAQEACQPVLMLRLDCSPHADGPCGRWDPRPSLTDMPAMTPRYAGRAPVRESAAHQHRLVEVRRRGRIDTGRIVEVVV